MSLTLQVKYSHVACTSWGKLKWYIQASYNTFRSCWTNEKGQQDKQWSTKDSHKTKYRVTSNTNPTCTGSLQWLLCIDLNVYQCMRKMKLNLFYDFSSLVYFWIGISWLIEHSSFDLPSRWSKNKSHQEPDLHHHASQHKASM
jgi:hypothetical protein